MGKYLITGATGYIGSMLIKSIISDGENDINITAIVRDSPKARAILPKQVNLVQADLGDSVAMNEIAGEFDYIIHCASITKSSEMKNHPVEVIRSVVNSTQNVMELAIRSRVKSVVILSSMEVYGNIDCSNGHRATEDEASEGAVELLNVRSCYPLGKRMAENICFCYYKEYGVPVKVARLAQTFGKGILQGENRVFAQFIHSVLDGKDIVLHTLGNSTGNYCSIQDAIAGILTILNFGIDGEAYNVVNEDNTMTIGEMAELVCERIAERKIKVVYDIPEENSFGYAADTGLRLSARKLLDLGWEPHTSLVQMYRDLLSEM